MEASRHFGVPIALPPAKGSILPTGQEAGCADGLDILAKRIEEAGCADRRTGYFSEENRGSWVC